MWLSESGRRKPVKTAIRRKEAAWKKVLATTDEEPKERCMETYRRKEKG